MYSLCNFSGGSVSFPEQLASHPHSAQKAGRMWHMMLENIADVITTILPMKDGECLLTTSLQMEGDNAGSLASILSLRDIQGAWLYFHALELGPEWDRGRP